LIFLKVRIKAFQGKEVLEGFFIWQKEKEAKTFAAVQRGRTTSQQARGNYGNYRIDN
jgi:hypothetical protein